MEYRTFEPDQKLKWLVKCYWNLKSSADELMEKQSIVPDGCMEMIFHSGDPYQQYTDDGKIVIQPRCFVIGQITRPLEIQPTGETDIFSVRFHPDGFAPFATFPITDMENTAVSLQKIFGEDGNVIGNQIINAQSPQEKIELIEMFLTKRMNRSKTIDHIVRSAVETILISLGQLSVEELSKQTPFSRRQLERKFHQSIGLSPKQLSKIIRLQTALKMLLNQEYTNMTSLAYENEYYDQSHFIKDFKELVGTTPKELYGNNLKMTSWFNVH